MVGRLAKHFKGGFTITAMMEMNFEDVFFWYKIYERQIAEEIIIGEFSKNNKPLPNNIDRHIENKLKEWHNT